jgi:hypothetical protein
MKKSITYINLLDGPACKHNNRKYSSNGDWLDNRTVCITKFNARLLMKPFGNKPSLISFNITIIFSFEAKNLFTANHIH